MAAQQSTQDQLHDAELDAIRGFAVRQAEIVVGCARALRDRFVSEGVEFTGGLPIEFLLEIGAIGILMTWEESGIWPQLPPGVLTPQEAAKQLHDRVVSDPLQFRVDGSAELSRVVRNLWLEHFSWTAPATLGIEAVLGHPDEDELVEAMAQLLWKYRDAARRVTSC